MSTTAQPEHEGPGPEIPRISNGDSFGRLVRKLSFYFMEAIQTPYTFNELKNPPHIRPLMPLITYLTEEVHHESIVCALLALRCHFVALENDEQRELMEARGNACEVVAWRFVSSLSTREAIDVLLYELPSSTSDLDDWRDAERGSRGRSVRGANHQDTIHNGSTRPERPHSRSRLLGDRTPALERRNTPSPLRHPGTSTIEQAGEDDDDDDVNSDFFSQFVKLNGLEVAAVSQAKSFLSQKVVQTVVDALWTGQIVFWDTMSVKSRKQAKIYNKRRADPYCRLRVPCYLKTFETLFFAAFLAVYYKVLIDRDRSVSAAEVFLYIFIASFACDEFYELREAGQALYVTDVWNIWDSGIIIVGALFVITRCIGLIRHSDRVIDASFDVLSLEALFLIPRLFSLLSLNSYFGTLIPCLKEMTKDFIKFLGLVVILYLGFLTTFTLLARDRFTTGEMAWILIKVFFGSSYLGFDVAQDISPALGSPLMLIFVTITNILLITSLISLLSASLTKIILSARQEYLFTYSVYVLEASTSNRLTYFIPPLNLIPLFLRPLRLFLSAERLRAARIVALKVTHLPHVLAISAFENGHRLVKRRSLTSSMGGPEGLAPLRRPLKSSLSSPRPRTAVTINYASQDGSFAQSKSAMFERNPSGTVMGGSGMDSSLKEQIGELRSEIAALTRLIAEQNDQQHRLAQSPS